jgi:hypothetical protein
LAAAFDEFLLGGLSRLLALPKYWRSIGIAVSRIV